MLIDNWAGRQVYCPYIGMVEFLTQDDVDRR